MSTFKTTRYPELVVKFSSGARVKFQRGVAEVDGAVADKLADFAKNHPDYEIEQVDGDEARPATPKERLKAEARALGLDDSGKVADLEARIAAHKAAQDAQDADEADDENDDDHEDPDEADEDSEDDSSEDDEN